MFEIIKAYTNIQTVLASLGLVLATSSFISGLQLVRGASMVERHIHRYNGFTTFGLYLTLAVMAMVKDGFYFISFLGWITGLLVILTKVYIVRKRRRRSFKYVSWIGGTLILIWLYLMYIHIPL